MVTNKVIYIDGASVKVNPLKDNDGSIVEFFTVGEDREGKAHFPSDRGTFRSLDEVKAYIFLKTQGSDGPR